MLKGEELKRYTERLKLHVGTHIISENIAPELAETIKKAIDTWGVIAVRCTCALMVYGDTIRLITKSGEKYEGAIQSTKGGFLTLIITQNEGTRIIRLSDDAILSWEIIKLCEPEFLSYLNSQGAVALKRGQQSQELYMG